MSWIKYNLNINSITVEGHRTEYNPPMASATKIFNKDISLSSGSDTNPDTYFYLTKKQ
jgi:hypothetical protein